MSVGGRDVRQIATVFGGTGFIGRHVVKRLVDAGFAVRVAVRDAEAVAVLRPLGVVGQVVPLHAPLGDAAAVARAVDGASCVVNLVGILAERRAGDFDRVHHLGAAAVAQAAAAAGVARLVQDCLAPLVQRNRLLKTQKRRCLRVKAYRLLRGRISAGGSRTLKIEQHPSPVSVM